MMYKTEGRNKKSDRETARKILIFLTKNKKSITYNYSSWLKVAFAIANSFTFDVGKDIFLKLCRLDMDLHDEYKSENLLRYCYCKRRKDEITFSSIIYLSGQAGFVNSKVLR